MILKNIPIRLENGNKGAAVFYCEDTEFTVGESWDTVMLNHKNERVRIKLEVVETGLVKDLAPEGLMDIKTKMLHVVDKNYNVAICRRV